MPKATKQTMQPVKIEPISESGGVLSRIKPLAEKPDGAKVLIFGNSKTGKSRMAATFPKPLLIIGTQDGTQSIPDMKGIDFVLIKSSDEFGEIVESLPGKYKSAALDLASGLQDLITKEVLGLDEVPVQRTYGMTGGPGQDGRQIWGAIGMQFKERMKRFLALADRERMDLCVIAHERNFSDDPAAQSDLIMPTIGAALTPSAAGWLHAECDILVQAFKRQQMKVTEDKVGEKKISVRRPTGKIEYCLRIGPHPIYLTELRRRRTDALPDAIVDPTFAKLMALVR